MVKRQVNRATVNRIKQLSREGKSANEIQRQLQREHRGIRRTVLLTYVREFKGQKRKPDAYKYTPYKYRRPSLKHIAIYGRHNGKSKRIEVYGTPRQLYNLLRDAVKHPPRQRFVRGDVKKVYRQLDMREEWDAKPTVKS